MPFLVEVAINVVAAFVILLVILAAFAFVRGFVRSVRRGPSANHPARREPLLPDPTRR